MFLPYKNCSKKYTIILLRKPQTWRPTQRGSQKYKVRFSNLPLIPIEPFIGIELLPNIAPLYRGILARISS